jgi:CRISPR-associated protein Cas1
MAMDARLWPARNVGEHAYCPRLFYLMEVEGLHRHSADTLSGLAVHKNVDRPSRTKKDAVGTEEARSLVLTSQTLGITATLDMAVMDGQNAQPLEYRKGMPKRLIGPDGKTLWESWPVDRVQLGLQAILLEQNGYKVTGLSAFYAATKTRLDLAWDDSVRQEALATLASAKQTAADKIPLPLVNDPRCVGCSMQPVCLPDEVTHQLGLNPNPRKVWPPDDEGIQIVAQTQGLKVGVRAEELVFTPHQGADPEARPFHVPVSAVNSLSLLGSVQISTQAIHVLAEAKVPIAFLSSLGRLVALVEPMDAVSARLKAAQVRALDQPETRLELARRLIVAKISNQKTLLNRNHPRVESSDLEGLSDCGGKAGSAETVASLLGLEGRAAAIYFRLFGGMVKGEFGEAFSRSGRQRRPPPDPVNAVLSMAYTTLANECVSALKTAGLEPVLGALHANSPGRPSLALDLMEPFRPLVADSLVITAFNKGELVSGYFQDTAMGCRLTDHGRRAFFKAYTRRMETRITHPEFGYKLTYRRMLILHARMIAAWFAGEFTNLSFITTR